MLFDTHAHLNFRAYDKDRDEVIESCLKNNIRMINVGTNFLTSKIAVVLAQKYEKGVYAAVGLHPIHLDTGLIKIKKDPEEEENDNNEKEFDYQIYKELAQDKKVVAIGETGLDYYWKPKTKGRLQLFKEQQKELFLKHIQLAQDLSLPIIIHCRMAHDDLIEILKLQVTGFRLQGVIHCFTGTWEQAEEYLNMGFYFGFNGIIFKLNLDEIIEKTPIDKILVETDCPYLTPPGFSYERNDPRGVEFIAKRIAEIKSLSFEEVASQTTNNAKKLFSSNNFDK